MQLMLHLVEMEAWSIHRTSTGKQKPRQVAALRLDHSDTPHAGRIIKAK
jgi:hypothetical protein